MKKIVTYLFFVILLFLCVPFSYSQILGDANSSGNVDIVDALLIAQYYVGLNPQGVDVSVMDVNASGIIDIIDALLVAQYYVGLISIFPGNSATTSVPTPAATTIPSATPPPGSGGGTTTSSYSTTTSSGGTPIPEVTPDPGESDFFYFSYDDSASTAAVELTKYKLNNGEIPDPGLARPWEFLNFEEFDPEITTNIGLFDISMGLWERDALKEGYGKAYKLGVYCASPTIPKEERKNVVLTILVDVSGSMGTQSLRVDDQVLTRMDLVHYGLNVLPDSLKDGDVINIATFETTAEIRYQGLQVPADLSTYLDAVEALTPLGTTNLADGIDKAYQAALDTYDPEKTNRVIILTDAYANTGEIDPAIIAQNVIINNQEGIYFSGLGISEDFNEAFLNELTDAGKGAYYSIVTQTDAQKAFKDRFIALLSIAAKDVQFKMDYPAVLEHDVTAAEETSTDPAEVQTTNFSYNTSQYFFEGFLLEDGAELLTDSTFKLTISYINPADGTEVEEIYEASLTGLLDVDINLIRDAETIYQFTQLFGLQKSWGEICPVFTSFYDSYSSPIYDEYWDLMQKFVGDVVEVSPNPVLFINCPVGDSEERTIAIANNTLNPIDIYNISFQDSEAPNPFTITEMIPQTIQPLEVVSFKIIFAPESAGTYEKVILIDWSYTEEEYEIVASGSGVEVIYTDGVPVIPNPVEFGEVFVGDVITIAVTIVNKTENPVDINNIYFEDASPPNPFSITVTLPVTIPTNDATTFEVHFAPESTGDFDKVVMIDWSYASENYAVNLLGTGITTTTTTSTSP